MKGPTYLQSEEKKGKSQVDPEAVSTLFLVKAESLCLITIQLEKSNLRFMVSRFYQTEFL